MIALTKTHIVKAKRDMFRIYLKALSREMLVYEYYDRLDDNMTDFTQYSSERLMEGLDNWLDDVLDENPHYEHFITMGYLNNS